MTPIAGLAIVLITGCGQQKPAAVSPARPSVSATAAGPAGKPAVGSAHAFPRDLPAGQPRGLTAAQTRVDRRSADAVAVAFVVRLELWDTRLDRRPNDAARRAVGYATPTLRGTMLAGEPEAGPGTRWAALAEHHGWTTVRTESGGLGEKPPTTITRAVRSVTPVSIDHGTDGWTSYPESPGTYIVTLQRTGKDRSWAVSSYTIQ